MAYELTVDHPEFPDGMEFDCGGILVENGKTVKITEEMEMAFIARHGRPIKESYGHGTYAKLTGSTELTTKAEKAQAAALIDARTGGEQ